MANRRCSIVGCGWLGFPVGVALAREGWRVRGSTQDPRDAERFRRAGIRHHTLRLGWRFLAEDGETFFTTDVLMILLPFRRDLDPPTLYPRWIADILEHGLGAKDISQIILTGSTSVYADHHGRVSEESPTAVGPRPEALLDAERLVLRRGGTVLRLAGLYGPGRPVRIHRGGDFAPSEGRRRMNLCHRDDASAVLVEAARRGIGPGVFNVCAPGHPTRRELSAAAARLRALPEPVYRREGGQEGKIVDGGRLRRTLGYVFRFPDPIAALAEGAG